MLEIVNKVDELRHQGLNGTAHKGTKACGTALPRLQYYGMSYGTFIGNTFASMFPGRVGRMILDAVVDAEDYVQVTAPTKQIGRGLELTFQVVATQRPRY